MRTVFIYSKVLLFMIMCFARTSVAQSIIGIVTDENNSPLPGVNVSIPALHHGAVTDENGAYKIDKLNKGVYAIEFILIGYKKETRSVVIAQDDVTLNVLLSETALEVPGVIITGKPQPTDILSSSQSVSVVEGRELARMSGTTVMSALDNSAGVSLYSTGGGIAKPVIRGLTSQRVLVVSEGARQEGQQWGDEHGPEIDGFDVKKIEVLRGPSSVLYGSDALGGVVNIIKHELPCEDEGFSKLSGSLTLNRFSNNDQTAGDLTLFGALGEFGYRGHISLRDAGNISTPERSLFNSGFRETNGGGMIGVKESWGVLSLDYSHVGQEIEIHEDPAEDPLATPYQKVHHDKLHLHSDLPTSSVRIEVDGTWQRNGRKEFEEKTATEEALHLELNTYSLDVKGHHTMFGPFFGTVGLSLMSQANETLAEENLIPGYSLVNVAGFLYEEVKAGLFNFSAGLRFDARTMDVERNDDLGVTAQTRNYDALTGTLGAVWRLEDQVSFAANLGRGWRSPSPFELFVNGVHEGTVQYLIGNHTLVNEQSINIDLSLRYATNRVQSELTFFNNKIENYIFASPTGNVDTSSGFQVFQLTQADATLIGAEISLQAQVNDWLILSGGFDYLRGTNDKINEPLPLITPNRLRFGMRLTTASIGSLLNPYLSINAKVVSEQNRVEQFELPTAGYSLFDIGAGGEVELGNERMTFDFSIENLFDKAYRDHLSRYKLYALNPGRNVALKVGIPFTLVK